MFVPPVRGSFGLARGFPRPHHDGVRTEDGSLSTHHKAESSQMSIDSIDDSRGNSQVADALPKAGDPSTKGQGSSDAAPPLAQEPNILDSFIRDLDALGIVGEIRAAKLLYLVLTTRFLKRPVSAVINGPSSSGKSYLVEHVLKFFPAAAYYTLSAMSEKVLAYSKEPIEHRFLVLLEAAGIQSDFTQYLLRSLLSEGRLRYETVERTKEGLQPRLIERSGPTGLLVTTTGTLHAENKTRMFSILITDTMEQTAKILRATAQQRRESVNLKPWHELQRWLDSQEHRVIIPYAEALADKINPVAVRLRRDFPAVLQLIQAHALLHQATRARDAEGRIIATLDDYAVVRDLVDALMAEDAGVRVSPTVRDTVNAVQSLIPSNESWTRVTVAQVAKVLKLDKSAALRRVQTALTKGYLRNEDTRKGHPKRLTIGDPLPNDQSILPSPESLEVAGLHGVAKPHINPYQTENIDHSSNGCRGAAEGYTQVEAILRDMLGG